LEETSEKTSAWLALRNPAGLTKPVKYGTGRSEHAIWFFSRYLAVAARIVAETFESLGMKFPEPTVNIKEIARK
jgi:hypothetical protein